MTNRDTAEHIIQELHAARIASNLAGMCRLFADDGRFAIAGASLDKPIAIKANGLVEFRPWLAMLTKVFRLTDYRLIALVVEWPRATAHWEADIHSKVTGITVPTQLVDLFELNAERIFRYTEFFVPR